MLVWKLHFNNIFSFFECCRRYGKLKNIFQFINIKITGLTGAVLLSEVLPGVMVGITAPFYMHKIPYKWKYSIHCELTYIVV